MTTEELVNALCNEAEKNPCACLCEKCDRTSCMTPLLRAAAFKIDLKTAKIKELEEKIPRWIPVTERLPEANEGNLSGIAMVLVTVQPYFLTDEPATPYATSAAYDIEQRIFDVGGLGAINAVPFESDKPRLTITHWMPLPEAAKEV